MYQVLILAKMAGFSDILNYKVTEVSEQQKRHIQNFSDDHCLRHIMKAEK